MPHVHSDLDGSFLKKFHFGIFSVFCGADGSMLLLSPEFVSKAVLGFAPCPENSRPSHEHWKNWAMPSCISYCLSLLFRVVLYLVNFIPSTSFTTSNMAGWTLLGGFSAPHPTCPSLTLGLSWQANSADSSPAQLIHLICHPGFVCFCLQEAPHFTHLKLSFDQVDGDHR